MKKSTLKTLLLASIVYLAIIAVVVFAYSKTIDTMKENTARTVLRIKATEDIVPGTVITPRNVATIQTQDILDVEGLLYKMAPNEAKDEEGNLLDEPEDDNRFALGKVATEYIASGEWLSLSKVANPEEIYDENQRLYAIPFDADTTGGYNVSKGEYVDIAVAYNMDVDVRDSGLNATIRSIFAGLDENQITDIVLAKRLIEDIRDETGESVTVNEAVKPGYLCFRLTYEEINKLLWAKQCGTLFIGKSKDYIDPALVETFMQGMAQPAIGIPTVLPVASTPVEVEQPEQPVENAQ